MPPNGERPPILTLFRIPCGGLDALLSRSSTGRATSLTTVQPQMARRRRFLLPRFFLIGHRTWQETCRPLRYVYTTVALTFDLSVDLQPGESELNQITSSSGMSHPSDSSSKKELPSYLLTSGVSQYPGYAEILYLQMVHHS